MTNNVSQLTEEPEAFLFSRCIPDFSNVERSLLTMIPKLQICAVRDVRGQGRLFLLGPNPPVCPLCHFHLWEKKTRAKHYCLALVFFSHKSKWHKGQTLGYLWHIGTSGMIVETVKILITPDLPDICKIGLRTMLLNAVLGVYLKWIYRKARNSI